MDTSTNHNTTLFSISDIFVEDVNGRYYIDCHFKRPVFMPGTMIVKTCNSYDVCQVKVEDKASSVPHLVAKIVKLHQQRLTRDFSFRKHKTLK